MQNELHDTIQALLDKFVAEGNEHGVQVAAYIDGELVVDAFAGVADIRNGRPVDGDSVFPVFSVTKGIFATVIHILAERGVIDYDAPIAKCWPEFGVNGKEAMTLRHVLTHTSGIPFLPEGLDLDELWNWDYMCGEMAKLRPVYPIGERQHYHPLTFGWIVAEVARRLDGRMVQQLLAEEICRPLGMTRLYCGMPADVEPETAHLEAWPNPPVVIPPPPHDIPPCATPLQDWMNLTSTRLAPQPACSGIMSARSMARHYAACLPGGVDGVELLSPERMRLVTEVQVPTGGYIPGQVQRKGIGYQLGNCVDDWGGSETAFGHGGYGGAQGFADPKYKLALGLTRNRFSSHNLGPKIIQEIRRHLGDPVKRP